MSQILLKMMITMFLLCAAGYIARKMGIIDSAFSKKLSTLIIKIGQPFLIIAAIIGTEYSKEKLISGFIVIGIGTVCHGIMALISVIYSSHIKDINKAKITKFSLVFANCGFLGLPVVGALLGEEGLFYGAFYQIPFQLFVWSYGMIVFARGRDDIKISPKSLILNYGMIPCFIGIALYILKPYFILPDFITSAFNYLGSLCTPISQLIIGGLIELHPLKVLFSGAGKYAASTVKLVVFPLMFALICKLLGVGDTMTLFIVTMSALPCATNSVMFGEIYDIDPEYAAHLVGVTSILSVATVPFVVWVAEKIISL